MAKYTFLELQTHYAVKRGAKQFSDLQTQLQTEAKNDINMLYELIWYHKQWGFAGERYQLTTLPAYTTGTVSGSAGGRTLTGSSTAWPQSTGGVPLRGQMIYVNGHIHKIKRVTSTTQIILESQLTSDVAAGSTYSIYFVFYPMPNEYGAYRDGKRDNLPIQYRPESIIPSDYNVGPPDLFFNGGVLRFDQNSFTGTLTNASANITSISGITIDDTLIGASITPQSTRDVYYVIDITGSTIILDRTYQGSTLTGTTVLLNPRGTQLLGVYPYPDVRYVMQVNYTFAPNRLVADSDYSMLPTDVPLLAGVEYLATEWKELGNYAQMNEVIFNDKKFRESMKTLNFRGTPLQNRIYLKGEDHTRNMKTFPRPWNQ